MESLSVGPRHLVSIRPSSVVNRKEEGFVWRLNTIVNDLRAGSSVATPSLELVSFEGVLEDQWFISNHTFWAKDQDLEVFHRT